MPNPKEAAGGVLAAVRRKRPGIDHTIRSYSRYQADGGDRLAAGVTYFGFLSFFPLVALAFSVAGFVIDAYPKAQTKLVSEINSFLPGLSDKLNVATIGHAKVATGIVGLAGLLLSGLGWIDALRDGIRTVWHHNVEAGNFIVKKIRDIVTLVGLGLTLLASIAISGVATAATKQLLKLVSLDNNTVAQWFLSVLAILVALAVDFAIFAYLFTRLPRLHTPLKKVMRAAIVGAVGLEILKSVGTFLVGRTTHNPVYGAFAVVVGLLIWINLVTRWTLFVSAFAVTAAYDSDVSPSGTASVENAQVAGMPEGLVGTDPAVTEDGAPSTLGPAVRGQTPPQEEPTGPPSVRGTFEEPDRTGNPDYAPPEGPPSRRAAEGVRPPGAG